MCGSVVNKNMPLTPDQEDRLLEILKSAVGNTQLNQWEVGFVTSLNEQYENLGEKLIVSSRMWVILEKIDEKIRAT